MRSIHRRARSSRRWRQTLAVLAALAAATLASLTAATPSQAAKLFVVLSDPGGLPTSGPILRYDLEGPADSPALEATITDPAFDLPCCLAFSPSGEMFVSNRGDGVSPGAGSITRILNPQGIPSPNGTISSPNFSGPHWGTFRSGELFVAQRGGSNVLRFLVDAAGSASYNGEITAGLCCTGPRAAAVSPTGELFVSQCCGDDKINRYVFDAAGNAIPNGDITGGGLSGPHGMAFSPSGELFVNGAADNVLRFRFDSAGNASPNGQITGPTMHNPVTMAFSPWGELFVANLHAPGGVARWTFDSSGTAIPNGFISTPNAVVDVQFPAAPANRPPDCSGVTLDRTRLWPPNHRYVKITATGATDPDSGDAATLVIDAISQDEPVNGMGDGNTAPDAMLATPPADHAWVRAERSATGDGRVYRLHYTATDSHGATCQGSATVSVPHDKGKRAIAPPYDSLLRR